MSSKNGNPELISLLQYMKDTRRDNPNIICWDERLRQIEKTVNEVKESEEWEAVEMSILSIGLERGQMNAMIGLLVKKLKKGATPEQIADMLEMDINETQKICEIARNYAPEYDVWKISDDYRKLLGK